MRYIRINLIGFFVTLYALIVFLAHQGHMKPETAEMIWVPALFGFLITLAQWIASCAIRNSGRRCPLSSHLMWPDEDLNINQ